MQNVRVDRDKYIGGSDIPVIMGLSSYEAFDEISQTRIVKNRFNMLQQKAGYVVFRDESNEYTEYGNVMEPKIRDYINEGRKDKFVEGKDTEGVFRCHTDGKNKTTILEIKTTSHICENLNDYKIYLVQLLFYMQQTKKKKGMLAVYDRPEDFSTDFDEERLTVYELDIKEYKELLEEINEALTAFLIDLEKVKENPFITEEELQPKALIELSNEVLKLENQLSAFKQLEAQYDEMKKQLFAAMEKYNIKKWTTNNGVQITRVDGTEDTTVMKFNEKRFAADNKELYEMYQDATIKKGRSGYVKITLPKE